MKNKNILPIIALFAVVVLAAVFGAFGGEAKSIVSVSTATYNPNAQSWNVALVVDRVDTINLVPKGSFYGRNATGDLVAQSDVKIQFSPDRPFCQYSLTPRSYQLSAATYPLIGGVATQTINYFTLSSAVIHTPYYVKVFKETGSNLFTQAGTTYNFDVPTSAPTQLSFPDPSGGGSVTINSLGQLSRGMQCPSEVGMAVLKEADGSVRLVDAYALQQSLANANNYLSTTSLRTFSGQFDLVERSWRVATQNYTNIQAPTNLPVCVQQPYSSCEFEANVTSNSLYLKTPYGTQTPFVTAEVSKDFVDAIVILKPDGAPVVTVTSPNAVKVGNVFQVTACIKNTGTSADSFRVNMGSVTQANAIYASSQTFDTKPLQVNEQYCQQVSVIASSSLGQQNINDRICATATALGSLRQGTNCADVNVASVSGSPTSVFPSPTVITPSTTPTPHTEFVCADGTVVDSPTKCKKSVDYTPYLLGGALALVVIIVLRMKKRK